MSSVMTVNAYLNPNTIDQMLEMPRRAFAWIGFDPIDNCNLHCTYCHNPRTRERIDVDKLARFLDEKIESINHFQIGCAMEPTLDRRLVEIVELIAASTARPATQFKVHTNGTLLHRHDLGRLAACGLTHLSISIDSANEETFRSLRGGADLERVFTNVAAVARECPDVTIQFIATVNRSNVDEMAELIERGLAIGAHRFHFREMYHRPGGSIVDDDVVAPLVLPPGRFAQMRDEIELRYAHRAGLFFGAADNLLQSSFDAKRGSGVVPVGVASVSRE